MLRKGNTPMKTRRQNNVDTTPTLDGIDAFDITDRLLRTYSDPFIDGQEADKVILDAVREIKRLRHELAWCKDVIRDAANDLEDAVSRDCREP